jgi:hypothetical protein
MATIGGNAILWATFQRCTVADNAAVGVRVVSTGPGTFGAGFLHGSIFHGNSPDLDISSVMADDHNLASAPDPQFVDRGTGDYRLRFGSPCVDAGDPATPTGSLDLMHVERFVDGDLDTHARPDIGAFEHQPLRLVTTGHSGTPARFEMAGQTGGTTAVYVSHGPLAPTATPFGQLELDPASSSLMLQSSVAPHPPVAFQRRIPDQPSLIGVTFSFQALTTSSLAPQGSAYTNVVSFTVLP